MAQGVPTAVWIHGKGRTARERRTIPGATGRALQAWLEARGPDPGALFHRLDNGLESAGRGRLSGEAIRLIVAKVGARAGIAGVVRPHGLRHAGITAALDATGGDIRAVAQFSRHKNVQTVLRYDDNRTDQAGRVARMVAGE
jgi:integrase/recombinase XerC